MRWPWLFLLVACGGGGDPVVDAPTGPAVDARPGDAPPPGSTLLEETFAADGAWPAGWSVLGGVASATVASGRGALVPVLSSYSLGRMGHALDGSAADVDVTFDLTFTNVDAQGIGFYVRQNGGYLQQGTPHGAGYAVFIEGFRAPGKQIGLWAERDGLEQELAPPFAPTTLANNVVYNVRFVCRQESATSTRLSAKIWPAGEAEPATFAIERSDATANLQNLGGAIAVDSWNSATSGPTPPPITIDNIVIRAAE